MPTLTCDLLVIGGGINGAGIARDAAGRGLSVVLCEKDDLAAHTSSASSKLVHGGLRYLEHYEFGLVRKSLAEREVLLRIAPHLVSPLRFVVPLDAAQRPAWMIRAGLFLYDHLARRRILPGSRLIRLPGTVEGAPLQERFGRAFAYSDAWVDDARLVVLNALDAAERGARILTRTRCVEARAAGGRWTAILEGAGGAERTEVTARAVVNAAGPFAAQVIREVLGRPGAPALRLVKGSHLVTRRLYDHGSAYLFQNPDRRIIFAIPFLDAYTLIGTTDVELRGDPDRVAIDGDEIAYLCEMASRYFRAPVTPREVVWSYSGVRPLLEERETAASELTRDYRLELETAPAPLLAVWGGKLTTYRRLAEEALALLLPALGATGRPWTAGAPLPGGDLHGPGPPPADPGFAAWEARFRAARPWLPPDLARRLARAYGTRAERFLAGAARLDDLGEELAPGLHEAEARHLVEAEWARTPEDVLFRRTKLGLRCGPDDVARLARWLARATGAGPAERGGDRARGGNGGNGAPGGGARARGGVALRRVSLSVSGVPFLHPMDLTLARGGINVLLGATQAGKTSLLRVLAGLDRPTTGEVLEDGVDVTGRGARARSLAMVFQQFINYPSLTVFENIASPLRLEGLGDAEVRARVREIAARLHIDHLLGRLPRELSGGQQQRTALARALAKRAALVLLDEPLVNLDYKLREELRVELAALFAAGDTTVVYATTEPQEALLLGGHTAVLHEGRLLQFGPTLEVYRRPASEAVARAFSDPPMNLVDATVVAGDAIRLADGATVGLDRPLDGVGPGARLRVGLRPNHLRLRPRSGRAVALPGTVELAELSGSETLLHLRHASLALVAQLPGVHAFTLGEKVAPVIEPDELFLFDARGVLLRAPSEAA